MRTTTPACSSVSTSPSSRIASLGVQRSGWKISPEIDDLLQPGAAFARPFDRFQQSQQFVLRPGAGEFTQRRAEGRVPKRAMGGERGGVGGQEGERALGVLTILGEVEMHAPDEPPAAVARGQKSADREAACGALDVDCLLKRTPQPDETLGVEILAAAHWRRLLDQSCEIGRGRRQDPRRLDRRRFAVRADRGDEPHGERTPERKLRRQAAPRFGEAQLQKPVPAAASECGAKTTGDGLVKRKFRRLPFDAQCAVGRQHGDERIGHRYNCRRDDRRFCLA